MMFSFDGIQKIIILMSKTIMMRRIICKELIVSSLIDFLMTTSTITELSHVRYRRSSAHFLYQKMKTSDIERDTRERRFDNNEKENLELFPRLRRKLNLCS